ncbi:MAG: Gfo/Idh/MocA family protein, partial [Stackebrandtia sp.]
MRIGFAGLAHSHPFTDAATARAQGVEDVVAWSDDPTRLEAFRRDCDCLAVDSLPALLARRPDAVVATLRPAEVAGVVAAVLDAGVPCFANKVVAATPAQLEALDKAVRGREDRFFTASVLRFAPAVRALAAELESAVPVLARAVVRHDISMFLRPERRWQDDPAVGGGTLVSVGLHGVELLDAVLGEGVQAAAAERAVRAVRDTRSEDAAALLLRWPD